MYRFFREGTKQANQLINGYDNSINYHGLRSLKDCYKTYSLAKYTSYNDILRECQSKGGYDFTILTANTWEYTCGYVYANADTGELILRVHTACNIYETWYV